MIELIFIIYLINVCTAFCVFYLYTKWDIFDQILSAFVFPVAYVAVLFDIIYKCIEYVKKRT